MMFSDLTCTAVIMIASSLAYTAWGEPKCERPPFGGFLYGTQYYRSPTPLPDEWKVDLPKLGECGLDTIQLRLNWRNNERQEDVYSFEDVDALMDLAEKHNKKVIIKFLLECAPQYVFEKYDGTRIGPKGERIRGGSHGAFYPGGWLPCFTNPKVAVRAAKFVRKVVERYHGRTSVIAWNAWNEPRNKPAEECFCVECRRAFGRHMKERFGTIDRLNDFYGVAEESFETIALPAMPHGYWDVFEFKLFKSGKCIHDNLKLVYDAVRTYDNDRPVVSHVGRTCGFQSHLGDMCDDFTVSKAVDGWGTSLPLSTCMASRDERMEYARLNDFLRAVNRNYFVYEIYPGLGMFKGQYDTVWDMDYKLACALACGSKGVNFWQYRSERVGMEADCAGLVRMDGTPRPVMDSVRLFGGIVRDLGDEIVGFYPRPAQVAIVFDYKSLLMSEIEDSCGANYSFDPYKAMRYYTDAHKGFYQLMRRNDVMVDYLNIDDLAQAGRYRILYFPHCSMLSAKAADEVGRFVSNGGVVLADEGFGMRQDNTWMNPYDIRCGGVMRARLAERRCGNRKVRCSGAEIECAGYHSEYEVADAKTLVSFSDGIAAAHEVRHGRGKIVLLGFSLGYSSARNGSANWMPLVESLVGRLDRTVYGRYEEDIEERRLYCGDECYLFLINSGETQKTLNLQEPVLKTYGKGSLVDGTATIPPKSFLIVRCRTK